MGLMKYIFGEEESDEQQWIRNAKLMTKARVKAAKETCRYGRINTKLKELHDSIERRGTK